MDRIKPILVNQYENLADKILQNTVTQYAARCFPKVRVADVVNIDMGILTTQERTYALQAHFDFVITDEHSMPQFAIELDGSQHTWEEKTRARDQKKNSICEKHDLPLLRIDAEYLRRRVRGYPLLQWLVEVWFSYIGFLKAQEQGYIPDWEDFDYRDLMEVGAVINGQFVSVGQLESKKETEEIVHDRIAVRMIHDFTMPSRRYFRDAHNTRLCGFDMPMFQTVFIPGGYVFSLGYMWLSGNKVVIGEAKCKLFRFPPLRTDSLAQDLAFVDTAEKLKLFERGRYQAVTIDRLNQRLQQLENWQRQARNTVSL